MKHGNKRRDIEKLRALQEKEGIEIPSLENMPEVDSINHLFWSAFQVLSKTRLNNGGLPQPIQVSEILAYAKLMDIDDPDDRDDLLAMILIMDEMWLEDREKKRIAAEKKAKQRRGRASRR